MVAPDPVRKRDGLNQAFEKGLIPAVFGGEAREILRAGNVSPRKSDGLDRGGSVHSSGQGLSLSGLRQPPALERLADQRTGLGSGGVACRHSRQGTTRRVFEDL